MRGSLAIWCATEKVEIAGHSPKIELHFNIWSGLPGNTSDVLDIGFLFKEYQTIQRLFLYIPGKVDRSQLKDLSGVLKNQTTLSAVFNNTLDVGEDLGDGFDVVRDAVVQFRVLKVDTENSDQVSVQQFVEDDDQVGTIIIFEPAVI